VAAKALEKTVKRGGNMKSTLLNSIWAVSLLAAVSMPIRLAAQEQPDKVKECSNATLQGSFGFTSTGTILPPLFGQASYSFDEPAGPFAEVGRQTFDGNEKGETEYTATISNNGEPTPGLLFKGNYSVNEDCTGTMTLTQTVPFPSTVTFNFVIDDNGSEIRALLSGPIPAPPQCGESSTCIVESRVYKKQ
jgi:hypothetical protein